MPSQGRNQFKHLLKFDKYVLFTWFTCMLQVEVDWDKIKAKVDMELQKEAARPGAKPYNG